MKKIEDITFENKISNDKVQEVYRICQNLEKDKKIQKTYKKFLKMYPKKNF